MSPSKTPASILVIGYGNPLRADDGAGQVVAQNIEAWQRTDVRVLSLHQLMPEIALDIAQAALVYFVDASLDTNLEHPRVTTLEARPLAPGVSHFSSPQDLLALAQTLYGAAPKAYQLELPSEHFGLEEGLSGKSQQGVKEALAYLHLALSENIGQRVSESKGWL